MCILFVARRTHDVLPLLILANRDEFFSRPTRALHRWEDQPGIIGGRDELAGGGWMGISDSGRIAAVTNLRGRGLRQEGAASRGELVSRWLAGEESKSGFEEWLAAGYTGYNPFNLLYGDVHELALFSSAVPQPVPVVDGFLSISNGPPADQWPKMSRGAGLLEDYVRSNPRPEPDSLLEIMTDNSRVDWSDLRASEIPIDYEEALSSIYVDAIRMSAGLYGTRSTSILAYDGSQLGFHEYTHDPDGNRTGYRQETIRF